MAKSRMAFLLAHALCLSGSALPLEAASIPWPEGIDPSWHPDPTRGDVVMLGGDLSDGNYAGGVRADGAIQHVAGRHFVSGDGWWVLVCRHDDCGLEPASLEVEESAHRTYDGPDVPGQRLVLVPGPSGEALLHRSGGDPHFGMRPRRADDRVILVAFKPVRSLSTMEVTRGRLTTWWYSHPRSGESSPSDPFGQNLLPATERQIRVGRDQTLDLRQTPSPEPGNSELQLEIEFDGVRQSLGTHYVHMAEGTAPVELGEVLQWVGDLDGDGRPDMLINHSGYYWDLALWLSSLAAPGELVGEAGRFTYAPPDSPGC